jgi:hypothetical protein
MVGVVVGAAELQLVAGDDGGWGAIGGVGDRLKVLASAVAAVGVELKERGPLAVASEARRREGCRVLSWEAGNGQGNGPLAQRKRRVDGGTRVHACVGWSDGGLATG